MTVDQQPETGLHEVIDDLCVFQCEQATLAGGFCQLNRVFDEALGFDRLVDEGFHGDLGGAKKLTEAELHHRYEHRAAQDDQ